MSLNKHGQCRWCKQESEWILTKQLFQNGSTHFLRICSACGRANPGTGPLYIANELVEQHATKEQIENLPVLMQPPFTRCVVCGRRDTENHHWAPKALFGPETAEKWPQDYLCKACHRIWHETVTPGLVK